MVRGLGRTACRHRSDAGALRYLIDQPRRIHWVDTLWIPCGHLVDTSLLAPEGRR
jgi:hypothetical protein